MIPSNVTASGLALIQAWEGLGDGNPKTVLLEPYLCSAGVATVGWGHAILDDTGQQIRVGRTLTRSAALERARIQMRQRYGRDGISHTQAQALFAADITPRVRAVRAAIDAGRLPTTPCELDAMVSLAFNIGTAAFEKSTVCRLHVRGLRVAKDVALDIPTLVQRSQSKAAPATLATAFVAWSWAGGKWSLGLFRRRMCELMVYRGQPLDEALAIAQAIKV